MVGGENDLDDRAPDPDDVGLQPMDGKRRGRHVHPDDPDHHEVEMVCERMDDVLGALPSLAHEATRVLAEALGFQKPEDSYEANAQFPSLRDVDLE